MIVEAIYDLLDTNSARDDESRERAAKNRVEAIMSRLDKNSDKVLCREEFINGCLQDPAIMEILVPYA